MRDGDPILYVERGGKGLMRLMELEGEELAAALSCLTEAVRDGTLPRLGIEKFDGEPVMGSDLEAALVEAGFARQPRRLVAAA
jgi:ATP-dependent Lhr-like helicase